MKIALRLIGLVQLLLALALGWWAASVSLAFGAIVLVTVFVGFLIVLHNFDGVLSRRFLARDDKMLFHVCEAGGASLRRFYRHLPASPRCRICLVPFAGVGRWLGIRPSRKNANFCQSCIEAAPIGGHEIRTGVLFADIRGFTPFSAEQGPSAAADLLSRFYALASDVLTEDDALVELVGDQVMAIYLPMFPSISDRAPAAMIDAARRLQRAIAGSDGLLPVGVGLHIGTCSVGNVGKGGEKDFTAVGDVVNTAARLQSHAGAGEIILSSEIYTEAGAALHEAKSISLDLKGKEQPFTAYLLSATQAV